MSRVLLSRVVVQRSPPAPQPGHSIGPDGSFGYPAQGRGRIGRSVDGTIREQADGRLGPARAGGGNRWPMRRETPVFGCPPTIRPSSRPPVRPSDRPALLQRGEPPVARPAARGTAEGDAVMVLRFGTRLSVSARLSGRPPSLVRTAIVS